jgi:transposase
MATSVAPFVAPIHLGLDVSKDKIMVGVLRWDEQVPDVVQIFNDQYAVRQLIARFPDCSMLRVCYEAGPTGYGLYRLLRSLGVACDVVAPALIPKAPGDRVKTDKRDCRRLARLHRAGELVVIRVPTPQEEAVRDLCRARADMIDDRDRTRHRLNAFLLRHDRVWRQGMWTGIHDRWLDGLRFDDAALRTTYAHYRAVLCARVAEIDAIDAELKHWYQAGPFAEQVLRLAAYRGVAHLGALTIASEVGDWRRFPCARTFMGFTGLVPSEYSSGNSVHRGHITRAGNAHLRTQLIESVWAYQHRPHISVVLKRRHQGVGPDTLARSWKAQQRLCGRFRRLGATKSSRNVVATAVARELAGFLWNEMTAA